MPSKDVNADGRSPLHLDLEERIRMRLRSQGDARPLALGSMIRRDETSRRRRWG